MVQLRNSRHLSASEVYGPNLEVQSLATQYNESQNSTRAIPGLALNYRNSATVIV